MNLLNGINEFKAALDGIKGELDAWLEVHNEDECKTAINGLIYASLNAKFDPLSPAWCASVDAELAETEEEDAAIVQHPVTAEEDVLFRRAAVRSSKLVAKGQLVAAPVVPAPVAQLSEPPEGWKLVPIVPTDAMRDAGNVIVGSRSKLFDAWRQMLAAAPTTPKE